MKYAWYDVSVELPKINKATRLSRPVIIRCQEFGQSPSYAVARMWFGIDEIEPKWYLDAVFYNVDYLHQVANVVTHWFPFPILNNT
jgi:hypothetical protein